jgi:hypothetical protein
VREAAVVTHIELQAAFGNDPIRTMPGRVSEQYVSRLHDRRILTEVGLPESLLEILFFSDLGTDTPTTGGDLLHDPRLPGDIVIANGLGGLACLSAQDGTVYWHRPGDERSLGLVNSSLDHFVACLHRIWLHLRDLDLEYGEYDRESPAELGRELRRIAADVHDVDPPSFDSPVRYWQTVVFHALRYLAQE